MKRILAFSVAVLFCILSVFCGCTDKNKCESETVPETTVTTAMTEPTTTVPPTTVVPTTVPINADDSARPKRLSHKATGDEAGNYKYVAFTFDDGPHYDLTFKFVDKLDEYGGAATFFVVGNRVTGTQAKAVKYAYDHGNEIGIHTWTHSNYYDTCSDDIFRAELSKTHDVIKKVTGVRPITMRPVGGSITSQRIKDCGYSVIHWSVDSNDWRYSSSGSGNVSTIVNNVLGSVGDGDIILMHEIYYNSYEAFCIIADSLYSQGYRFVTVEELLELSDDAKGQIYYSAT